MVITLSFTCNHIPFQTKTFPWKSILKYSKPFLSLCLWSEFQMHHLSNPVLMKSCIV
jgi:hypothetical protein